MHVNVLQSDAARSNEFQLPGRDAIQVIQSAGRSVRESEPATERCGYPCKVRPPGDGRSGGDVDPWIERCHRPSRTRRAITPGPTPSEIAPPRGITPWLRRPRPSAFRSASVVRGMHRAHQFGGASEVARLTSVLIYCGTTEKSRTRRGQGVGPRVRTSPWRRVAPVRSSHSHNGTAYFRVVPSRSRIAATVSGPSDSIADRTRLLASRARSAVRKNPSIRTRSPASTNARTRAGSAPNSSHHEQL